MTAGSKAMTNARSLAQLNKTILLVGAGKMGGALLEGWLSLGLEPRYAAVLEPQPSRELSARGRRRIPGSGLSTAATQPAPSSQRCAISG